MLNINQQRCDLQVSILSLYEFSYIYLGKNSIGILLKSSQDSSLGTATEF
jgi:hypothetical protein